ncbi:hypothetical protein MMC07_002132 [Pseudocyphellaria aurata]|nr:hypothetical protein [Pseudocyphellaria aurata]
MLCAISGEVPRVPVASRKSGNVFERSLIETFIEENGKDPVTNEDLNIDDLVDLKSPKVVRPRPPTLTSIPSLLSVLQSEWDALALEHYTLKQTLTQTRQELSTALYQHDAATRVISRLSRERDEARDALSRINLNGGAISHGDAMQVDGQELSAALVAKVEATQEKLSKTRRKRIVPDDWATSDVVQTFKAIDKSEPLNGSARSIPLDNSGDLALVGGVDGSAGIYSISQKKKVHEIEVGDGSVTDAIWVGERAVFATSAGNVKIFESGIEVSSFNGHLGEVAALAVHPSKEILASVGVDKSYIFYDLTSLTQATQVYTNSCLTSAEFHPDGHLFAAGGIDGQIKVYDTKSGLHAANFDMSGSVQDFKFSENGTWLAAASKASTSVSIWDLRKSAQIKLLEVGGQIERVQWDYTGQFLAIAGPSGLAVKHYSKSAKEWSEILRSAVPAVALEWGSRAQKLVSLEPDGTVLILGAES